MIYVLYHGNCYDGFGAAYAAWKKLGDTAKYIPVSYNQFPPEIVDGKEIYIVDFSYPPKLMNYLAERAKVVVLDHHKTAKENLEGYSNPNVEIIFDMNKSGSLLAWEYFHGLANVPDLIKHISDRDLWKFELDGTSKIHKALVSYPMDFELWDSFNIDTLKSEGEVCERLYSQLVENICSKHWIGKIAGYNVPVVNTTFAWSEVGDHLVENNSKHPFVATFTIMKNSVMWSLRSKGDFDVSEIAKQFGGGGHKNAAGFKTHRISDIEVL